MAAKRGSEVRLMAKGFGTTTSRKKKNKPIFPLVASLRQKLKSGELVTGQSTTWEWLEGLTEEEESRLFDLRDSNTVNGTAELILVVVLLLQMETGKEPRLSENEIQTFLGGLAVISATKELIEAGLIEVKDLSGRLSDINQPCNVRLTGE
jgi:hypothetical protein